MPSPIDTPAPSKPTFAIAVRSLVEYVLRRGDLRHDFIGTVSAVEGIRAHQQIQSRRPAHYMAEVPVARVVDHPQFELRVSGRIDGVMVHNGMALVEEIKSTRRSLDDLEASPNLLHWGQAQCYAYLWAREHKFQKVTVRLTYLHVDSRRHVEIDRSFELDALSDFFDDLVGRYIQWVTRLAEWTKVRQTAITRLDFPFAAYRRGQREMAVAVYRNIRDRGHLLLQAATGIGKTMGVLFAAVKSLGEGIVDTIVFLTARTTGRLAAESALTTMARKGLRIKSITVTAKEKICFDPQSNCDPDACQYAKGHFDRINAALTDGLKHDALTREIIEALAVKHQVCPFEFSLELVNWCDCVICDYNYAFAPGVVLQRLFGEESGRQAVLVDEAHNLVDRSREMFSAQLSKRPLLALRRLLKDELPGIHRSLGQVNYWMAARRRRCKEAGDTVVEQALPQTLIDRLRDFLRRSEKWLRLNLRTEFRDDLLESYFEVSRFIKIAEGFDHAYAVIYDADGNQLRVKLYCIDPSGQLCSAWKRCRAAVLFSATLTPAGYFQALLGCHEDAVALNLPSPFSPSNLAVFVADRISTLYRQRERSCDAIVRTLLDLVEQRHGHYLLFFPSYAYLDMVHHAFLSQCPHMEIIVQAAEMTESQKESFLERFKRTDAKPLVGFAVMGGIFGEGIDLTGDRLTGAVIVGVGLPGMTIERDLIKAYFDGKNRNGFEFAYQYPGINRVLQAAGRVIRTEQDQGVILLIDRRYGEKSYRDLLPDSWELTRIDDKGAFQRRLETFWKSSIASRHGHDRGR
jgi:DNA excision repair protein ERCC-2